MTPFPFSALVGQEELRLALLLNAVDPAIGGVLLRGQKGSAKTTAARGLAALLPGEAPFVELPVGASEDRLIGSIDLRAALVDGERRFVAGLLGDADGGVLYVDEVNLLPDHLVDVLLDVAASGVNRVEREGVSHTHPSRFILLGSMNPEEGELRPQLLDRFGLSADVLAPTDPTARAEAVRRRLAFDADPVGFAAGWEAEEDELRRRLAQSRAALLAPGLIEAVAELCVAAGAEGLRADLVCCRAAAALAGWEGKAEAGEAEVRAVAGLALGHRRRRSPFEAPGVPPQELADALDDAFGPDPDTGPDDGSGQGGGSPPPGGGGGPGGPGGERAAVAPGAVGPVLLLGAPPARTSAGPMGPVPAGRRSVVTGDRGRLIGDRVPDPGGPVGSVAVMASVLAGDLREAVRREKTGNLVILVVDASGSMGADKRMEAAKGAAVSLLLDAYQRRDSVALVVFRGEGAEVVLRPTGSVEVARARLETLPTGGRTPLWAGIDTALGLAEAALAVSQGARPLVVLVSDGRATAGPEGVDPVEASLASADRLRRRGVPAVVVDAEDGHIRLDMARPLAEAMGARYLAVGELTAEGLAGVVRDAHLR